MFLWKVKERLGFSHDPCLVLGERQLKLPVVPVHGTRLDISREAMPGLMAALCGTRTVLGHIMAVAGPDLMGSEAVGSLLGICSVRAAENVLQL